MLPGTKKVKKDEHDFSQPGFNPKIRVIDFCTKSGGPVKCIRAEVPGRHVVSGVRTVTGCVEELGRGVRLRFEKVPDIPSQLGCRCPKDQSGSWERTLWFDGDEWMVDVGHEPSFDMHGVFQFQLVPKPKSSALVVCPHFDLCDDGLDSVEVEVDPAAEREADFWCDGASTKSLTVVGLAQV